MHGAVGGVPVEGWVTYAFDVGVCEDVVCVGTALAAAVVVRRSRVGQVAVVFGDVDEGTEEVDVGFGLKDVEERGGAAEEILLMLGLLCRVRDCGRGEGVPRR